MMQGKAARLNGGAKKQQASSLGGANDKSSLHGLILNMRQQLVAVALLLVCIRNFGGFLWGTSNNEELLVSSGMGCDLQDLQKHLKSPFLPQGLPQDASVRELVGLAKARYALQHPLERGCPDMIATCEASFTKPLCQDMVLRLSHMSDLLALEMPEETLDHLLKDVTEELTIVDIGANQGQFALPLAKRGFKMCSFEPDAGTCEVLKTNIRKENVEKNMAVTCMGIDDKESTHAFGYVGNADPGSESWNVIDPNAENAHVTSTVKLAPVSKAIDHTQLDIFAFKTDTQGNELAVLKGSKELLTSPNRPRFLLIEHSNGLLHSAGTEPIDLLHMVAGCGCVCAHLVCHHSVSMKPNGIYKFARCDTPATVENGDSLSVNFETIVKSIGPHKEWTYKNKMLPEDLLKKGGWTDLICFG